MVLASPFNLVPGSQAQTQEARFLRAPAAPSDPDLRFLPGPSTGRKAQHLSSAHPAPTPTPFPAAPNATRRFPLRFLRLESRWSRCSRCRGRCRNARTAHPCCQVRLHRRFQALERRRTGADGGHRFGGGNRCRRRPPGERRWTSGRSRMAIQTPWVGEDRIDRPPFPRAAGLRLPRRFAALAPGLTTLEDHRLQMLGDQLHLLRFQKAGEEARHRRQHRREKALQQLGIGQLTSGGSAAEHCHPLP